MEFMLDDKHEHYRSNGCGNCLVTIDISIRQ